MNSPRKKKKKKTKKKKQQKKKKQKKQASTFRMFITPEIEKIILDTTNLQGSRTYGDGWKGMDETNLRAYVGLLILAGVYRSRGEAAASLWDAENGRAVFRGTMQLKVFYVYSKLLRFDDRETRQARQSQTNWRP